MEWTRERKLEYAREWRKNNKDRIKEYNKQWRDNNLGYFERYYNEHAEEIKVRSKEWRQENSKPAIYLIVDKELHVKYIGSCSCLNNRISAHLTGNSHLRLNSERWEDLNLSHIEYTFLDNVSKEERLYIEYYLINKLSEENDLINEYTPYSNKFNKIDVLRKSELESYADSLVFKLYKSY